MVLEAILDKAGAAMLGASGTGRRAGKGKNPDSGGFLPENSRRPALWHSTADLGAASTAAGPQTGAAYLTGGPNIFRRSEILVFGMFAWI